MRRIPTLVALALAACGGSDGRDQRAVIQNKGSDTLLNVAQAWAEAYAAVNPDVRRCRHGRRVRHGDLGHDQRHCRHCQFVPQDA